MPSCSTAVRVAHRRTWCCTTGPCRCSACCGSPSSPPVSTLAADFRSDPVADPAPGRSALLTGWGLTAPTAAVVLAAGVRGTAATVWVPGRLRPVMAAVRHLPAPYSAGSRPGPPPRADRAGSCRPLPPRTSSAIGSARTAGSRHIEAAVGFAVRMIVVYRGLWRVHGRGRGVADAKPTTICTDWVEELVCAWATPPSPAAVTPDQPHPSTPTEFQLPDQGDQPERPPRHAAAAPQ